MTKTKVVIIGAGPAGLTAGYELLKDNDKYEVVILEESGAIGGISKTVNYNGNRMDIGGHRFFSKDKKVIKFWEEIMPIQGFDSFDDLMLERKKELNKIGPDPEKEDNVMLVRTRVSRIYYLKKFFDYPISMKIETFLNMGFIRTIKSGISYLKSVFVKRKEESLEDFYINRFGKQLYSMFFEKYTEKLWGRHPSQISADWGAQRVKGLSLKAVFKDMIIKLFRRNNSNVETSLIQQFLYPKYGPGQLWENVAQKIVDMGGEIRLNHCVKEIKVNNGVIESILVESDKSIKEINGDIFLSSMPIKDLIAGIYNEEVPDKYKQIAEGLPYRDFITVGVLLKKLKLKNKTNIKTLGNIVPDCWIYVQEANVKLGRIQIFNNWSPYMVNNPMENVWIGLEYFCNENDEYWNMTEDEFVEFALSELENIGIANKEDVIDTHLEKIKKAYPAYFDTYEDIDCLIEYINSLSNLYCIGRNGQHRYNNMDHSMVTAMEAVKNIKNNNISKENIWNVNTEKEYHEGK